MPTQQAGINHDHGMCRAVLHANPGSDCAQFICKRSIRTTSASPATVPVLSYETISCTESVPITSRVFHFP